MARYTPRQNSRRLASLEAAATSNSYQAASIEWMWCEHRGNDALLSSRCTQTLRKSRSPTSDLLSHSRSIAANRQPQNATNKADDINVCDYAEVLVSGTFSPLCRCAPWTICPWLVRPLCLADSPSWLVLHMARSPLADLPRMLDDSPPGLFAPRRQTIRLCCIIIITDLY